MADARGVMEALSKPGAAIFQRLVEVDRKSALRVWPTPVASSPALSGWPYGEAADGDGGRRGDEQRGAPYDFGYLIVNLSVQVEGDVLMARGRPTRRPPPPRPALSVVRQ
jgi:hypothetical protein